MRFVFDTNTLISALLFKNSSPGRAFYFALERGTILLCSATISELIEVISRKKFDKYLTHDEREEFLESLLAEAEWIEVSEELKVCRDPKDDKFLSLALIGRADFIVTGDDDLLVLKSYRSINILNARDLLELFSQ
ncbi:MAG: putative toxin-antitoxin system toxin component, PIN family [Leptolyngbyaceae bacterium]|nr:putative toxin-antitoxin system toxin component, PIN family [Leptolyngbyaceae bacterium]